MPPNTRRTHRENTPPKHKVNKEWDTPSKTQFLDRRKRYPNLKAAAIAEHVPYTTARDWVDDLEKYGSPAKRHTRPWSNNIGRLEKLSPDTYKMLVSLSRNPVRDQQLKA